MNNGFTTTVKSFFNCYKYISLRGFTTIKLYATVCTLKVNDTLNCVIKTHALLQLHTLAESQLSSYTYRHMYFAGQRPSTLLHTCTHAHIHTHTKDIKAQGIANVEDALEHDLSRHINDPFHSCILFLLLTVKTASRKKKKRCFFFLINMQKKKKNSHTHPHTSTVNKTYRSTVPTKVHHLVF